MFFIFFFALYSNFEFLIACQATISTGRLSRFLCCPEIETATSSDSYASSCTDEYPCVTFEDVAVVINEACCLWCSNDQEQLVMDHVTLSVPKGHLIAVVGEVSNFHILLFVCKRSRT